MSDDSLFASTDRCVVILMLAKRLQIRKRLRGTFGKTSFYFDKEHAKPWFDAWQSGAPIPVEDIRDIFQAEVTFNSAIHDEI